MKEQGVQNNMSSCSPQKQELHPKNKLLRAGKSTGNQVAKMKGLRKHLEIEMALLGRHDAWKGWVLGGHTLGDTGVP